MSYRKEKQKVVFHEEEIGALKMLLKLGELRKEILVLCETDDMAEWHSIDNAQEIVTKMITEAGVYI